MQSYNLSTTFHALANPTRRAILAGSTPPHGNRYGSYAGNGSYRGINRNLRPAEGAPYLNSLKTV